MLGGNVSAVCLLGEQGIFTKAIRETWIAFRMVVDCPDASRPIHQAVAYECTRMWLEFTRSRGWPAMCNEGKDLTQFTMTPIDPKTPAFSDPRSSMAPPYVDEDVNLDLVQQGLDEAEDETRDAVADAYESSARQSDESSDALDDIDFTEAAGLSVASELSAVHEDFTERKDDEGEEE